VVSESRDVHRITVTPELAGRRLDKLLVDALAGLGRARAGALFAAGKVWLVPSVGRARRASKGERARAGCELRVTVSADELADRALADATLLLVIALERDDLVVVEKPAGVPSAPLAPSEPGTIAGALVARYPEMAAVGYRAREPGLCHRLDTATSGLLLAARSEATFTALSGAIAAGRLDKRYQLVCRGAALPDEGLIELPLGPDSRRRGRVRSYPAGGAIPRGARTTSTRYRVLRRAGDRLLVEAMACPAYRHQVRAHLAAVGAPIVGDELYGGPSVDGLSRHALHACRLVYGGDDRVAAFAVSSPLPPELEALLDG